MTWVSSLRRHYIDEALLASKFHGKILDIGGKKAGKRGRFRPPRDGVRAWEYLNLAPSTNPDYLASAEQIAVANDTCDFVLISEVLEHLSQVLLECTRVLKNKARLILISPFLFPLHQDPYDLLVVATGQAASKHSSWKNEFVRKYMLAEKQQTWINLDQRFYHFQQSITTGYYVQASKDNSLPHPIAEGIFT